jgi:hypothetical protein
MNLGHSRPMQKALIELGKRRVEASCLKVPHPSGLPSIRSPFCLTPWSMPKTLFCAFGASLRVEKPPSGSRRSALMHSKTLRQSVNRMFKSHRSTMVISSSRRLHVRMHAKRKGKGKAYHSTPTNFTPLPLTLAISFWILVAASPPPAPPCWFAVPRMTCVTLRRPRAMDILPPRSARRRLSLWSETSGAVEPLM